MPCVVAPRARAGGKHARAGRARRGAGAGGRVPPVFVDDRPPRVVEVTPGQERYELAKGLAPDRPHAFRMVREAEAFAGVHEVLGVDLAPGAVFLPDKPRARLEIIGDSISAGYGVIGEPPCHFSFDTERVTEAYGALLGRALEADVTTIAWSGKGAYRSFDGTTAEAMPALFEQAIPRIDGPPDTPAVRWAFSSAPPADAVIVALGTNDFMGGGGKPLDGAAFEDAVAKLAQRLREVYPAAPLFLVTSPMLPAGPLADEARARLEHVVSRRTSAGDAHVELVVLPAEAPHWGCDHHPDRALNARIASALLPRLRSALRR
ncbi:MAG: Endoglucanase precursor [Labilithrix sp.]|nr:Endoglucanase precursor [Labilithrix sp.]